MLVAVDRMIIGAGSPEQFALFHDGEKSVFSTRFEAHIVERGGRLVQLPPYRRTAHCVAESYCLRVADRVRSSLHASCLNVLHWDSVLEYTEMVVNAQRGSLPVVCTNVPLNLELGTYGYAILPLELRKLVNTRVNTRVA